jgi:hypothetical protein
LGISALFAFVFFFKTHDIFILLINSFKKIAFIAFDAFLAKGERFAEPADLNSPKFY